MFKSSKILYIVLLLSALVAPFIAYPIFLMKVLSFALFACAFNLLIGFTGLLSFGHAMFFGGAAYLCAYAAKAWGLRPSWQFYLAPWGRQSWAILWAGWRCDVREFILRWCR